METLEAFNQKRPKKKKKEKLCFEEELRGVEEKVRKGQKLICHSLKIQNFQISIGREESSSD